MSTSFDYVFSEAQKPLEERITRLEKDIQALKGAAKFQPPSSDFISCSRSPGKCNYRISQIEKET
jgi:hypothetical protein